MKKKKAVKHFEITAFFVSLLHIGADDAATTTWPDPKSLNCIR